jgi:hypothetical protein
MPARIAILLLVVSCASPLAAAERRTSSVSGTPIRPFGGDWSTVPQAVNNRGEIAGFAIREENEWVAFIRSREGRYQSIADRGFVYDMNDKGDVVGVLFVDDFGTLEGFIWNRRRGLQTLGNFLPFSINERSDMAGVCETAIRQGCVMRDGVVSVIPDASEAHGINRAGTVVGVYGDNRAFRLTERFEFVDIGRGVAEDINDHGVIAGHRFLQVPNRGERAVVTAFTGRTVRSPGDVGLGVAINESGWVISIAFRLGDDGVEHPYSFAWNSTSGKRVSLASSLGEFIIPEAINDRGLIVGTSEGVPMVWNLKKHPKN